MKRVIAPTIISAILLALCFSPPAFPLIAWVAFIPFFFALDALSGSHSGTRHSRGALQRRVFLTGWLFGFVFFVATLYWVVSSLYLFGGVALYLSIAIMLLLVCVMALYPAFFALVFVLTRSTSPVARLFVVASAWVGLEFLRATLLTGLPWVLTGYTQANSLYISQIADIGGVYLVSFLVVGVNFALYTAFYNIRLQGSRGAKVALVIGLVMLTSSLAYGFIRVRSLEVRLKGWQKTNIAIVQGSIDQSVKWSPENRKKTVEIYKRLSLEAKKGNAELIIWPESAMPFFLYYEENFSSSVSSIAKKTNAFILTGSPHFVFNKDGTESYFNSAFLLNPAGEFIGRYDKVKLVPFGEYVPMTKLFFFLKKLTNGYVDFTPGEGHLPLKYPDGAVGVIICFESIFPDISATLVRNNATILAIITNDGWFGRTSAPYQHFDMARFRAIENRIYLIRAANTGLSGVIDPLGRVRVKTGLYEEKVISAPVSIRQGPMSFFTRYGRFFPVLALLFSALSILIILRFGGTEDV